MPPPHHLIQSMPAASHRALPPVPPNGHIQPQPLLPRHPPFQVSIPVVPVVAPPLPKFNIPFNYPQKNPDYFPTYSCKEEIYVSSSSVIELDCSSSTNNDGSDSGIYNASTTTGNHVNE